jgi:hypothetical protein
MKIIGKTNTGFIFEATKSEIEKLDDKYYSEGKYVIGTVVEINEMYDQVKYLKNHRAEIETVQRNLQRIIDNLTLLNPFVAPEKEKD